MVEQLSLGAQQRIDDDGLGGDIFVCKNNIDVRGNTFGCHENYLIPRRSPRHNRAIVALMRRLMALTRYP